MGCYKDTGSRAIPILEGKDSILDGFYPYRVNPIAKCAVAAIRRGYHMFAVQDGGQCFASVTAPMTFDKYGKSTACRNDGEGGAWANEVYVMKGTALKDVRANCFCASLLHTKFTRHVTHNMANGHCHNFAWI